MMKIPKHVIEELESIPPLGPIPNPFEVFEIGIISIETMNLIGATSSIVHISKQSLKHIIDRRGSEIIHRIPDIISDPTKIVDNSINRINSFILVRMDEKARGAVVEITKTPDQNRVVSAFPIVPKTYKKLKDISGRPDVPP